jgi:hypothetical protein
MRRPAALFPIALALGAVTVAPWPSAQAQDAREGPIEIEKCQTISHPGSYKLANNLTFMGTTGTCLSITANFVTIDLAGFTISANGPAPSGNTTTAVAAGNDTAGITVRNGSISGFIAGVDLGGDGSIVEGLHVTGVIVGLLSSNIGIAATGIVKGNTVSGFNSCGISSTGTVTGNYATGNRGGICVGEGSTVIGNTAMANFRVGFDVACPSNFTDNTAVHNEANHIIGMGCNNTNNVAP